MVLNQLPASCSNFFYHADTETKEKEIRIKEVKFKIRDENDMLCNSLCRMLSSCIHNRECFLEASRFWSDSIV